MKKPLTIILTLLFTVPLFAQVDLEKANSSNTWLKLGVNAAVPITDLASTQSFGLGLDASVQFLETKASGIGLKVGYINYFGKDKNDDIGVIPLAIMYRYYPESFGWFAGLEAGYAFITNFEASSGGIFVRPQLGLHYDTWNFFAYYDQIRTDESGLDLQAIGVGATYNLRFD